MPSAARRFLYLEERGVKSTEAHFRYLRVRSMSLLFYAKSADITLSGITMRDNQSSPSHTVARRAESDDGESIIGTGAAALRITWQAKRSGS